MSDTTKIDKVRVNGVLYDLAGPGSGGVSGAYLAPKTLISPSYTGFNQATINPIALIEQLEKAGISVDDPVMDSNESSMTLRIGNVYSNGVSNSMISLGIIRDSSNFTVYVNAMGGSWEHGTVYGQTTLREVINYVYTEMVPDFHFDLDSSSSYGYLENFITIYYVAANETLHYYISNMTEFCEEVIIEYHSGSDSSN